MKASKAVELLSQIISEYEKTDGDSVERIDELVMAAKKELAKNENIRRKINRKP